MPIQCMIVDDEPLATDVIQSYLRSFSDFEVVAVFNNSVQALEYLNNHVVDVLFIDINMPLISGFELIKLYSNPHQTKFVITTAYSEFAAESYDLDVMDYLVKPIPISRFIKCINKIEAHFKKPIVPINKNNYIILKVDKKMVKLNHDEILFIEGMKEYIKVITAEKTYITHKTLSSISEELPNQLFHRVHKSFTIATNKVKSIEGNILNISGYKIPIGRKFAKEVKTKILEQP
ncbi:MAG: response regulator transcription factor [Bacteroidetes bacterium]|nr:response regulator transcription factor [Bacteroidota bacterium]